MHDSALREEVARILAQHGLPAHDLELGDGFSNRVYMTTRHVVRLNEGRFPDVFHHEATVVAHLASRIPRPRVIAVGYRKGAGEYLIQQRISGTNLTAAWPRYSPTQRRYVALQLGRLVRAVHQQPLAPWMANPAVESVLNQRRWQDAYHAPIARLADMVHDVRVIAPDHTELFDAVLAHAAAAAARDTLSPLVFLHGDIHFGNVIVNRGEIVALIDYEAARIAPRDTELDMFVRSTRWVAGQDRRGRLEMLEGFRSGYPEIFAASNLIPRLELFEVLWQLVQLYHWAPGNPFLDNPYNSLEDVVTGRFAASLRELL